MSLDLAEIERRIADSYELPNNVLEAVPEPVVTVRTSTYQHGGFIAECIEGVLMQETPFPFEYIIGEDFSTDGTREIVFEYAERYPDIIRVVTADYNVGMKANGRRCRRRARGKYVALCEGDDYWTDPHKLQKQVDFLEAHPDYSLCCGGYESFDVDTQETRTVNHCGSSDATGFSFGLEQMQDRWLTKTLTVLFRIDALREYSEKHYQFSRDVHKTYHLIKAGRGFYFNDIFGVYRIHDGGVHSAKPERVKCYLAHKIRRELYEQNGDQFTRLKNLQAAMRLFNYDLYHRYDENTLGRRMALLAEGLSLTQGVEEYRWIVQAFLPAWAKTVLKDVLANLRRQRSLLSNRMT